MDFSKIYNLYQKNSINFPEQKDKFLNLINSFDERKDMDRLLNSLNELSIDVTKNYVGVNNFLELVNNENFTKKLSSKSKKSVINFVVTLLVSAGEQSKRVLMEWLRLKIIFQTYVKQLTLDQAIALTKYPIFNQRPYEFKDFFREKKNDELYRKALYAELIKKESVDLVWYVVDGSDLDYISDRPLLLGKLMDFFSDPAFTHVATELLGQWSRSSHSDGNEASYRNMLSKLDEMNRGALEKLIINIIKKYHKNLYSKNNKYWRIEEAFRSNIAHITVDYLVSHNNGFFLKILNQFDDEKKYLHGSIMDIVIYGIQPNLVEMFINHPLATRRTFFDVYFGIKNSQRKDKDQVLAKFEEIKGDLIRENELNLEKSKEQDRIRLEKENKKVRDDIETIAKTLKENPTYYSERLLWLYEQHPELFLEDEKQLVIVQIDKILGVDNLFDIKNKAEVHYDKAQKNSFTRPIYMANGTLDRCYDIGKSLGLDMRKYKSKLIEYLPFAFNPKFFDEIDFLSPDEQDYIIDVYALGKRKDDLRIFHPQTFFQVLEKFYKSFEESGRGTHAITTLKCFLNIEGDRLHIRSKKKILYFLQDFLPKDFFAKGLTEYIGGSILDKYHYFNNLLNGTIEDQQEADVFSLRVVANEILCYKYKDEDSIARRLKQLQTITVSLEELPSGGDYAHAISPLREELGYWGKEESKFTESLKILQYPDKVNDVLKILLYSFSLQPKNLVTSYLQSFVSGYYKRISNDDNKYDALIDLKNKIKNKDHSQTFLASYFPEFLNDFSVNELELFNLKEKHADSERELLILNKNLLLAKKEIEVLSKRATYYEGVIDEQGKEIRGMQQIIGTMNGEEFVVLTEGKTDRKYLNKSLLYLFEHGKIKGSLKEKIANGLIKYEDMSAGGTQIYDLVDKYLSKLYPQKKFIAVFDSDDKDLNKKVLGDNWSFNDLSNGSIKAIGPNFISIIIPHPGKKNDKYSSFYNTYGTCIENYFSDEDLNGFMNPRSCTKQYCNFYFRKGYFREISKRTIYDKNLLLDEKKDIKIFDQYHKQITGQNKVDIISSLHLISKESFAKQVTAEGFVLLDVKVRERIGKIIKQLQTAINMFN